METETDKVRANRLEEELFQLEHAYNYIVSKWQEEIDKRYRAESWHSWLLALAFLSYLLGSAQMFFMNY